MSHSSVAVDFLKKLDVLLNLSSKVTLDCIVLQLLTDKVEFAFIKRFDLSIPLDFELIENDLRERSPYSVDVHECNLCVFSCGEIYPSNSCHVVLSKVIKLTLTLFVLRILTNHTYHPLSSDDGTLVADLFNRRSNFHKLFFSEYDTPLSEVVGGEVDENGVSDHQTDKMLSHLTRNIGLNDIPPEFIGEFDLKYCTREGIHNDSLHFDIIFFGHIWMRKIRV